MAAEGAEPQVEEEDMPEQDVFYVAEAGLESIKAKLKEGKEVTKEDVDKLTFPENLPDDAMMVPVDMRGIDEEFDDVEQMVEKLGPKGTAEAFLKARNFFEEKKGEGDDVAKPMTAKEWSQVLEEDAQEDMEEEGLFLEGEEEEMFDEEPEEEAAEGEDDAVEEPPEKKAKTD